MPDDSAEGNSCRELVRKILEELKGKVSDGEAPQS